MVGRVLLVLTAVWAAAGVSAQEAPGLEPDCAIPTRRLDAALDLVELKKMAAHMQSRDKLQYAMRQRRASLLCELIEERLLADEARRRGLADVLMVRRALDRVLAYELMERVMPQAGRHPIPDVEIEQYYREHTEAFVRPERASLALIMTDSLEKAHSLKQQAMRLRARGFAKFVRKVSLDDYTRIRAGRTPWFYRGTLNNYDPAVAEAAFTLPIGGKSGPLHIVPGADERFYLIRVLAREEPEPIPLSRVKSSIRSRIQYERREKLKRRFLQNLAVRYWDGRPPLAGAINRDKVNANGGTPVEGAQGR
ncbi:MAG: peptidyl-prolyl cis-trans isomerase [Myxococcales bacterium]|nr:peptidyl-prolyl cis-trans isomerase [Myxococcales bacterium]